MEHLTKVSTLISQALGLYRLRINALLAQQGIDMTAEMFTVMRVIWTQEGPRQQDLADLLYKDKAAITKIIHNLEKRDLLERVNDEEDARNKRIVLTPKGAALKKKVLPVLETFLDGVVAGFSEKELNTTRHVLAGIIDKLK
jgi:DNA-binding MarR family transcriptional regulator